MSVGTNVLSCRAYYWLIKPAKHIRLKVWSKPRTFLYPVEFVRCSGNVPTWNEFCHFSLYCLFSAKLCPFRVAAWKVSVAGN